MSTRKDYKPRSRKAPKRKRAPMGLWLVAGLAVGLFVAMLVFLAEQRDKTSASLVSGPAVEKTKSKEPVAQEPQPATKPKYDFYAILPEKEISISDEELHDSGPDEESRYQGPWMLQAGSFRSFSDADRLKASLAFQGLESSIDVSENDNGTWHRVRLGPFDSRREADRIKSRLARLNVNSIMLRTQP